jgi:hypothetical protein
VTVLALTFFIRIQVQPTDLLLPGLAVALVAITLLAANARFLPAATQTASVATPYMGDIGAGVAVERASVAFPEAAVGTVVSPRPACSSGSGGVPLGYV